MSIVHLYFTPPEQCPVMFCIADPHPGDEHVDYTGATWNEATGELITGHDGE